MPVAISLATASVRVAGRDVAVSGHTLALALYLAAQRRPVSRAEIASALFESRGQAGMNAVKVYVHRLRAVIGKERIIRRAEGYAYSESVAVDLAEIEALIAMADTIADTPERLMRVWRMLSDLSAGRPESVARLVWFGPIERRLRSAERQLRLRYRFKCVTPV